jgi:peroxiredoxin
MTRSRGQWSAVGLIVALLGGTLAAAVALSEDLFPVAVGSEAPNFQAVDISTGESVMLTDYRGEVVLLNIWATWCPPCREEMPSMERLFEELGPQGLHIVAVSVDAGDVDVVREFVEEFQLTFDILHDPSGDIETTYQTTGLPETFIIDQHGVIVKKYIGAVEWDEPAQQAMIRRLIG